MIAAAPRIFRFAPSPNGRLHRGHAYSALMNQRLAEAVGGRVLLRMEDIDRERCTPALAVAVRADLAWLGFRWEPPVVQQSARLSAYAAALGRLDDLTYPCFCTRGAIARAIAERAGYPRDPDGVPLYPGTCRGLDRAERHRRIAAGVPATRRLDMAAALVRCAEPLAWLEFGDGTGGRPTSADPSIWGDALISRKDVPTSYHLAVVVDDAFQGITDVVRGADLFHATSLHRLLQALLGIAPPAYHHHRLIVDAEGRKLSKSHGARSLDQERRSGLTADALRRDLGF